MLLSLSFNSILLAAQNLILFQAHTSNDIMLSPAVQFWTSQPSLILVLALFAISGYQTASGSCIYDKMQNTDVPKTNVLYKSTEELFEDTEEEDDDTSSSTTDTNGDSAPKIRVKRDLQEDALFRPIRVAVSFSDDLEFILGEIELERLKRVIKRTKDKIEAIFKGNILFQRNYLFCMHVYAGHD